MQSRISRNAVRMLAAVAMVAGTAAQAADLVANGGFETGDFTGWATNGNPLYTGVDVNAPQAGSYAAYLGTGVAGTKTLSQTLNTTAGASYDVIFWLQNEADVLNVTAPNSFAFSWGGVNKVTLTDAPSFAYTKYEFTLLATGASTALQFTFSQLPAYWDLDSVSANVSAVPEPSAQVLSLAGLAVCLAAAHVRRRRQTM
jgi:hypothetical protein